MCLWSVPALPPVGSSQHSVAGFSLLARMTVGDIKRLQRKPRKQFIFHDDQVQVFSQTFPKPFSSA